MEKEKVTSFNMEDIVNNGPPPDLQRRQLLFDSLSKIIDNKSYNRALARSNDKDDRGTFIYTCGAGYHGQLVYIVENNYIYDIGEKSGKRTKKICNVTALGRISESG